MSIERYRHPVLFYGLSTAIPWAFWFAAAYCSRIEPSTPFLAVAVVLADPGFFLRRELPREA
jgi:hypothetical protein